MIKQSQFVKDLQTGFDKIKTYFGFGKLKSIEYDYKLVFKSEPHRDLIWKNFTLDPNSTKECEINAGRAGAFNVKEMQILVRQSQDLDCFASVEIEDIYSNDISCLMHFSGEKTLSDAFSAAPRSVNFYTFGADKGQGLKIKIHNPNNIYVNVYVILWGDAATKAVLK